MRLAKAQEHLARAMRVIDHHPWLSIAIGLAIALGIALFSTVSLVHVDLTTVHKQLYERGDVRNLYFAAANAGWRDIPGWFVGPWNSPGVGYYRPLTSLLFFLECRAFHRDFLAYNCVSCLLHSLNAMLLFLLVVSLLRNQARSLAGRILLGLVAVYYFSTPANAVFFSVRACMSYWPAQNDLLSLTFGLMCLLLLDRYLQQSRRLLLAGSLCCFAASVGAKEMGHILMPMAVALIAWRRRRVTPSMAAFVVLGGTLWMLRRLVVPNPWGQHMVDPASLSKIPSYWAEPIYRLVMTGTWWPIAAALTVLLVAALGVRLRWPVLWIAVAGLVGAGVCAQFVGEGGSWAYLSIPQEQERLGSALTYLLAVGLFWRFRRTEPGLLAGILLFLAYLPILQFVGYHYLYWPGAFLALADAVFCACVWRRLQEIAPSLNWTRSLARAGESSTDSLKDTRAAVQVRDEHATSQRR